MKHFVIIIILIIINSPSKANSSKDLDKYFEKIFIKIAAKEKFDLSEDKKSIDQRWQLRSYKIRVRPKVGFAIPLMLEMSLVPHIELSWKLED